MMKKWMAAVCVLVMGLSLVSLQGLAADDLYTQEVALYALPDIGVSRYVFARTGSGWFVSNKVELDFRYGDLVVERGSEGTLSPSAPVVSTETYSVFAAVEAKIWKWVPGQNQWVMEQNYDIYNEDEHTIKFEEEDTTYCVQLYFWNPDTVAVSYDRNDEFLGVLKSFSWLSSGTNPYPVQTGKWADGRLPGVIATPGEDTRLFQNNPLPFLPSEQ